MERNLRAIPCALSVLSPVILGLPIGQAGRRLQVGIGIRLLPGASMGNPACGKGHEERDLTNTKAGSGLRGPPGLSWASTPQTRVWLLYCVMLSTYSSDINRGLSPHHLFLEKVNLELSDNKSPGHNKSVPIQKPLWWLSSLPDRFIWTLTATHVIVYSLPTVRGTGSLKHPRNVGASEEPKSLE